MYVHAKDAAGNWGALAPISFVLDRGPKVAAGSTTTVSALAGPFTLASATSIAGITAAEMFKGTDPGAGNGSVLARAPPARPRRTWSWTQGPSGRRWPAVWVRAKDANGIWGKAVG